MITKAKLSAETTSFTERKKFMQLPLEERHRVMAEQAAKMEAHYKLDTERIELQGGDIVEY